jgi:hypothetical protein
VTPFGIAYALLKMSVQLAVTWPVQLYDRLAPFSIIATRGYSTFPAVRTPPFAADTKEMPVGTGS